MKNNIYDINILMVKRIDKNIIIEDIKNNNLNKKQVIDKYNISNATYFRCKKLCEENQD